MQVKSPSHRFRISHTRRVGVNATPPPETLGKKNRKEPQRDELLCGNWNRRKYKDHHQHTDKFGDYDELGRLAMSSYIGMTKRGICEDRRSLREEVRSGFKRSSLVWSRLILSFHSHHKLTK